MEKEKVLVIDDERGFVELLTDMLSREGYEVIPAYDGDEGLKKAKKEQPDLILCDIQMPKKNGYEVLRAIRHDMPRYTPFIMISVIDDFEKIKAAYDDEADFYVSKPVEMLTLSKNIHTLLNLWKNKQQ